MNKFILRIALFLGLFVVSASPALAQKAGYATMDLTLKVSEYTGAAGGEVGVSPVRQPSNAGAQPVDFTGTWMDQCSVRIDAGEAKYRGEKVYNDVSIFAKANPGYTFAYWAESDKKDSKPAKADFGTEIELWKNILGCYTKYMLAANPGVQKGTDPASYYAALFRYHVYGTFLDKHNSSRTLFAVFEPATYTVTFNAKGGSVSPKSKEVKYQTIYGALPTPTKPGFVFDGWYDNESYTGTAVTANTTCTATDNHNLYAKWTAYTISFVDQESGVSRSLANQNYTDAGMPNLAVDPYQLTWNSDKYFAGYYTQPNGLGTRVYKGVAENGNLVKGETFVPTSNVTLYAHYSHTHHNMYWDYTYDTGYDPEQSKTVFHNLAMDDESGRIKYARLTFKNAANVAFKTIIMRAVAVSNKDENTLTNAFSTHTTALANINLHVGADPDVLNQSDVHVYFTDEQLASFASYTFEALSDSAANPNNAHVAANWMVTTDKANHNTILTYTGATGANIFTQQWSVKLSGLLINPDYIYVMPLFENTPGGWEAISQLAHTTGVRCAKLSEENGVATYECSYPIWVKNATDGYYNNAIGLVGFNLGGKDYWMNTGTPGAFEPFYNSAKYTNTGDSITVNPGKNTGATQETVINMTVPATAIPVIHFLPNGGELSPATPQYLVSAYDATVNLSSYTATREGYSFRGWKEDDSEGGDVVTSLRMSRAYTLSAQWESLGYQVIIHKNGGAGKDDTIYVHYLENMPSIASTLPTRTGYDFTGCWDIHDYRYYNANGTSHQPYNKKENSELWAGWAAKTYTVILDPNGAMAISDTITATYDETLPKVVAPSSSAFLGYFDATTGGNMYIDASGNGVRLWDKTTDNVTLYAHWDTEDFYTVTYHANHTGDGSGENRIRYFAQEDTASWKAGTYAGMSIPAGKRFMGWATTTTGNVKYNESDTLLLNEGGRILYAKWEDNPVGYTLWYGKGDFATNKANWKSLPFAPSQKVGDHHVWESGHIEVTEDFKVQDDTDVVHEIHYFVCMTGEDPAVVGANDSPRRMVMGKMGVAPCHEEDGTCLRTVHDLILPEDSVGHELHPETSDRAGVYGHFHIWTSHTEACNFACHMVRDFFLDYHSNFPYGLPDRTYEQIVEFETGHTIIKGNEYHMDDFPQGLLTFKNWNTKADGTGTTYHQGDIFVFPADSTHNIRLYAQWEIDETQAEHFVVHQTGSHYGTLLENGMQRVHTYERTIYINETDSLQLYRPDYSTYREYVRWYNFNTDHACPNLKFKAGSFGASRNFENQQGRFLTNQNNHGEVKFVAPANFNTKAEYQNGIDVACDQSAYTDGRFLSFGFQYSRMVWYFYGFDVKNPEQAATCDWINPRKLTKDSLDAMPVGAVKYIYIIKPNNNGFVWFWSGAHNGATINPISESGIAAKVEECRTIGNRNGYRMKLTKRADGGITIQTLSTQSGTHTDKYLSITRDKHFTFEQTNNDSLRVWYYSNPGRDINETNLGSIDGTRNNTSLLYLRNVEDDYLYTDALPNDSRLWKGVASSVAANLPSGTNTVGNTEPTLSQRLLFHIKPATIMADSMKLYISEFTAVDGTTKAPDKQSMREDYMEEQHVIAPTYKTIWAGPSLQYIEGSGNSFPYHQHTYCFYDNEAGIGTPTMCKQGETGWWQWKKNGVNYPINGQPTVATGRFANLDSSHVARIDTFTLQFFPKQGQTMHHKAYNVCRIVVEYMDTTVVGPSHKLGYDAVENAMRVAYEDFNINPRTGKFVGNAEEHDFKGTKVRFYTRALPYEESAYGFYDGSRTIAHYAGGSRRWFPYWGEYGLVSNSSKLEWGVGYVLANHDETAPNGQNRETGYSIYIDGSAIPGEVFELNVDNLKLCANSKMYCSAWVASVTDGSWTNPNFDFEVFAYNIETKKEAIVTTYTTGELANNGQWQHVLFPVTYHGEVGVVGQGNVQFRVRVINKGKNSRGNDFMIDDIGFFVKQPDFKAIQATTSACLQTGQDTIMPLYLRVDYEQLVASDPEHPHEYYYAWFDDQHHAVSSNPADKNGGYFWLDGKEEPTSYESAAGAKVKIGKISLSASLDGKPIYTSFKKFDDSIRLQLNADTLRAQRAYVRETGKDGRERYFLYIVQPLRVKANYTYHAAMSTDINNVVEEHGHDDPCTMVTHLDIIAGARIRVDGEVFTHESDICGNRTYTLDIEMSYLFKDPETGEYETRSIDCNADWLKGSHDIIIANRAAYGVENTTTYPTNEDAYKAVVDAVIAHHTIEEAENVPTTDELNRIYDKLVNDGLLIVNKSKFVFHPTSDNRNYMAFARAKVGGQSDNSHICPEPQEIFFNFPDEYKHGVIIGNATENAPDPVIENPRVIRVQHNVINHQGLFSFPLYQAVGEDQSALDGFVITAAESIERNANGLPQYVLTAHTVSNDGHRTNVGSVPADGCIVELRGQCLDTISDGEYNFALLMEVPSTLEENACDIRYAFFKLIVTPDILQWNPTVSVWNADLSWTDADNDKLHYVPLPTTQVIMPNVAKTVPLPVETKIYNKTTNPTGTQKIAVENEAQDYITYDIYGEGYYQPYSCSDIYFPVGASLMNQSTLNIGGQAFIDVAYTANKWQLTSFPIQGVVSGDIFIPQSESTNPKNPFSVAPIDQTSGNVHDRVDHLFYQNFYNASVANTTGNGEETVASSTWLSSVKYGDDHTSGMMANGVAIPYGYVAGGQVASALWLSATDDNTTLRLPKKADVNYKYFDKNTKDWGYMSEDIIRSTNPNYGKPVYTGDSTFTLRGHSASNVFLFGNPTFAYIDMKKFMAANKLGENNPTGTLSGTCYRLNGLSYVTSLEEVNADGSTNYYLPPYSAVLVQAKTAGETADVIITDDMLVDAPPQAQAPARQSSVLNPQSSTIFISATSGGFTTYAMVEEKSNATNLYDESEDADVFMMAAAQTPFVIYTANDGHAMAINRHQSLDYLPLSIFSNQEGVAAKPKVTITFTGDDTYVSEWDLMLLSTGKLYPLGNDYTYALNMYSDGTPAVALVHTRAHRVTTAIADESSEALHVYAHGGHVYCCADRDMHRIEVLSPAGQLVYTANEVGTYHEFNLAPGVYLVRVDGKVFKVFND